MTAAALGHVELRLVAGAEQVVGLLFVQGEGQPTRVHTFE